MGSYSTVSLCAARSNGQLFAAKTLRSEAHTSNLDMMMGLKHPNIASLREVFQKSYSRIYVLDLAGEGDLFNYIGMKQKLSEYECRSIFQQLFGAVQYLVS
jgi:serine/threonine protein kinase